MALFTALPLNAQTIAITGAKVYPVSGPVIENGTVLIRDGRIAAVGANVSVPANATRIDAAGKWVTPGIFNATTTLGVSEIGAVGETNDTRAQGVNDGVTAAFRVWEGFNPASPLLQVTKNDGITTVGVIPGGSLIGGQGAVRCIARWLRARGIGCVGRPRCSPTSGARWQTIGRSRGEVFARFR